MAVIKISATKSLNRLISYAEKKAEVQSGVNVDDEFAKEQMKTTRMIFNKNDGRQGYHLIQSFDPEDNITPEEANEIGQELAKEVAPDHEITIYTHTDREHIHNHICINSVNMNTGKKFVNDRNKLYEMRNKSNELCQRYNLVNSSNKQAQIRYTQAERAIIEKGQISWKDEIRQAIDNEKLNANSFDEFKDNMKENYGIEVKERGKNISFKHPDKKAFVRGKTLGNAYEKGTIENECSRQSERTEQQTQSDRPKQVTRTNERPRGTDKNVEKRANDVRNEYQPRDNSNTKSIGQSARPNRKGSRFNSKREREYRKAFKRNNERLADLNGRPDEQIPNGEQEIARDNQADIGGDREDSQLEIELDGPELQ
ncbi:relaxase/mobilization nuclease domain-containing protein [Staphylococcus massiliensis]|uniref:Putative relaxase n=9 Tax=Staphylococcus TaxID=1279 RepID=K9AD18_9STAP|nr:relaxase/mobilization nuclease domain-containing protein [Staphylococcus massiliensis]EKU45138.1 putative relaxase [Staphylococcus massiliensis S46]